MRNNQALRAALALFGLVWVAACESEPEVIYSQDGSSTAEILEPLEFSHELVVVDEYNGDILSYDEDSVVIAGGSALSKAVVVGSVLAGSIPAPMLRRVEHIDAADNGTDLIARTRDADLNEAIINGAISFSFDVDLDAITDDIAFTDADAADDADDIDADTSPAIDEDNLSSLDPTATMLREGSSEDDASDRFWEVDPNRLFALSVFDHGNENKPVKCEAVSRDFRSVIDLKFKMTHPRLKLDMKFDNGSFAGSFMGVETKIDAYIALLDELSLEYGCKWSWKGRTQVDWLKPIIFVLVKLPVVVHLGYQPTAKASASVSAGLDFGDALKFGGKKEMRLGLGVERAEGERDSATGITPVYDKPQVIMETSKSEQYGAPQSWSSFVDEFSDSAAVKFGAKADASVTMNLFALFYAAVGPMLKITAGVKGSAEIGARLVRGNECFHSIKSEIYAKGEFGAASLKPGSLLQLRVEVDYIKAPPLHHILKSQEFKIVQDCVKSSDACKDLKKLADIGPECIKDECDCNGRLCIESAANTFAMDVFDLKRELFSDKGEWMCLDGSQCDNHGTCEECAQIPGCVFCRDGAKGSGKCERVSDIQSGERSCHYGVAQRVTECKPCHEYTDCRSCAGVGNCGWCPGAPDGVSCIAVNTNGDIFGGMETRCNGSEPPHFFHSVNQCN